MAKIGGERRSILQGNHRERQHRVSVCNPFINSKIDRDLTALVVCHAATAQSKIVAALENNREPPQTTFSTTYTPNHSLIAKMSPPLSRPRSSSYHSGATRPGAVNQYPDAQGTVQAMANLSMRAGSSGHARATWVPAHRRASSSSSSSQVPSHVPPIPRTLRRPDVREIDAVAFHQTFPDFRGATVRFIRDSLPMTSQVMLDGVNGCHIEVPPLVGGMIPDELRITFPVTTTGESVCPTHILAFPPEGPRTTFTLFPVHQLMFSVNCAWLPHFPYSLAADSTDTLRSAILPVVVFTLPSVQTFRLLQTYLYNKNDQELADALLPTHLQWAANFITIERQVKIIHGFWSNACNLGVVDEQMYQVINRAWAAVYVARARLVG
ncbi:hypothetical protein BDZ97DRAFT_1927775 [Flammula alnicola]|nr:hypothetical protein BDZ97DRAFT_1927775 [Flammula alnicola]